MLVSLIVSADVTDSYGFNVLASQLKKLKGQGVKVQQFYIFYKFNEPYPQKTVDDLVRLCRGSDLIGISLLSSAYKNSLQITKALKKEIECPIIWGGKHPSIDPEDCIKYADMVGLSEGEDTLLEVVDNLSSGKSCDKILGLWLRKKQGIIRNPLRPLEANLDRFLFPDYSLENKFVLDKETLNIRSMEDRDLNGMRRWYPTMMTRGCPNFCTFCTNSTDFRLRTMRTRSINNVIGEIKEFLEIHPDTKRVFFRDDCISAMPLEFIKEFSSRWKKEVGLACSCSGVIATSENFEEKIKLLTEAGFINFKMGIQSGCERVRRKVFARVWETDEIIIKAVKILHSICKGKINYYMITDNPYESEEELVQSIRFTSKILRPFGLSLYSLNFYPGTVIYNNVVRDKILTNKEEALQESTMEYKNTYLNKVFVSLRFFALPPFFVRFLTSQKIYSNKIYQKIFNKIFKYLYKTDTPTRWIKKPLALRAQLSELIHLKKFNLSEFIRSIIWTIIESTSYLLHH